MDAEPVRGVYHKPRIFCYQHFDHSMWHLNIEVLSLFGQYVDGLWIKSPWGWFSLKPSRYLSQFAVIKDFSWLVVNTSYRLCLQCLHSSS